MGATCEALRADCDASRDKLVNDSLASLCRTRDAKHYVAELIDDAEARTEGNRGRPYFHYFLQMSAAEAAMEFYQIKQLPEGYRMDDLRYRMSVEGML